MGINENGKNKDGADFIVYGKIFTSENDRIIEAFAVNSWYLAQKSGNERIAPTL